MKNFSLEILVSYPKIYRLPGREQDPMQILAASKPSAHFTESAIIQNIGNFIIPLPVSYHILSVYFYQNFKLWCRSFILWRVSLYNLIGKGSPHFQTSKTNFILCQEVWFNFFNPKKCFCRIVRDMINSTEK